jgi:hypothetical protein
MRLHRRHDRRVRSGLGTSASIARRLAISQRNVAARRAQTATRIMSGALDELAVGCVDVVPAGTHDLSKGVRALRVGATQLSKDR